MGQRRNWRTDGQAERPRACALGSIFPTRTLVLLFPQWNRKAQTPGRSTKRLKSPPEISLETGSRLRPQEVPEVRSRYAWDTGSDRHQLYPHRARASAAGQTGG